jgi:16S rRNA (guanine(527)-N(7))-methyltransferase RsmG
VKIIPYSNEEELWREFIRRHKLTQEQGNQFKQYYTLLNQANELYNLTTITDLPSVLTNHFDDSLALALFVDCNSLSSIADVGSGAGFPGIPLKIKYPHLSIIMVEVVHKKIMFLQSVVETLNLSHAYTTHYDWRTFLRKTDYPIELFCARASLKPDELIRMFKPSSIYNNRQLVYWASYMWHENKREAPYIKKEEWYTLDGGENKRRKLVFFARSALAER